MNYEEFKRRFPIRNGTRQNKVWLACVLSKSFRRRYFKDYSWDEWKMDDVDIDDFLHIMRKDAYNAFEAKKGLAVGDNEFRFAEYDFDNDGICDDEDGEGLFVRYLRAGRPYKMRAGKLCRKLIDSLPLRNVWPEQLKVAVCERFAALWKAYAAEFAPDRFDLVLDDDFEAIYDSSRYAGDIHSCMNDKGRHGFYRNCVSALAASLRNKEGKILARCIVYTEVHDYDGNTYRLAERQYAVEGKLAYSRMLVNRLIQARAIDGYKKHDASYNEPFSFIDTDGEPFGNEAKCFYIPCHMGISDLVSYQDSFKDYRPQEQCAYASEEGNLDTTEDLPQSLKWCNHLNRYVDLRHESFVHAVTRDDYYPKRECVFLSFGYWEHRDDTMPCPHCGKLISKDSQAYLSELTDKAYCCGDCKREDEEPIHIALGHRYDDVEMKWEEHPEESEWVEFFHGQSFEVVLWATKLDVFKRSSECIRGEIYGIPATGAALNYCRDDVSRRATSARLKRIGGR